MKLTAIRFFVLSASVLLLATSLAKFISASGNARILQTTDPIFSIPFRHVFWIVGLIEFIIALVCFFGKRIELKAGLLALLTTNFLIYRFGLVEIGYNKPCSCLGNLTDALHIPPQAADMALKIILAYLLIGSYATLFWVWRQHHKAKSIMKYVEVKPLSEVDS
jgi:hypothetical protein